MSHSLLSRFRGVFLGGILGDAVTTEIQIPSSSPGHRSPDWYKILNYQLSGWQSQLQKICLIMNSSSPFEQQAWQHKSLSSAEWAYITLPIILFYHENKSLWQQEITKFAEDWQWSTEVLEDVLVWGYIVTLVLRGKVTPKNIIGELLVSVEAGQNSLFPQLKRLESWLFESPSLEQIIKQLSNQAKEWSIPLSIYCFSSTPEDFHLSILRATCCSAQTKITAMLTGALSGGYNGIMGIPVDWRVLLSQNPRYQEIDRQGKLLFDNWSGIYRGGQKLAESRIKQQAIAATGTIQPRSSLTIISQQE